MPHSIEVTPPTRESLTAFGNLLYEKIRTVLAENLIPRPIVYGLENLQVLEAADGSLKPKGAIFGFAPHNGHIDGIMLRTAAPGVIKSLLMLLHKDSYWNGKSQQFINTLRPFFVNSFPLSEQTSKDNPTAMNRASAQAQEATLIGMLEQGIYLVIAPEGTREVGNRNKPLTERVFKEEGASLLAKAPLGIPYIPVYFVGMEDWWPKGTKLPNFEAIYSTIPLVIIGKPIFKPEVAEDDVSAQRGLKKRLAREIKAETHTLEAAWKAGKYPVMELDIDQKTELGKAT